MTSTSSATRAADEINRKVDINAERKVTVALVAVEGDGIDIFSSQCAFGIRGYMTHSDGLCYKFHYSADITVTCDDSQSSGNNTGGTRGFQGGGGSSSNDTPICD